MARSREARRASFQAAQRAAIKALFSLWRAAIRTALKRRDHRKPAEAKVSAALLWFSKVQLVQPLFDSLRHFERCLGKPYAAWTIAERKRGARFAASVLNAVRVSAFERRPGRPKNTSRGRGMINHAMTPTPGKSSNQELVRTAAVAKLGAWARKHFEGYLKTGASEEDARQLFGTLSAARITARSWKVEPTAVAGVGRPRAKATSLSNREAARVFIEGRALPNDYEERIRKQIDRRRQNIIAELQKLLKE